MRLKTVLQEHAKGEYKIYIHRTSRKGLHGVMEVASTNNLYNAIHAALPYTFKTCNALTGATRDVIKDTIKYTVCIYVAMDTLATMLIDPVTGCPLSLAKWDIVKPAKYPDKDKVSKTKKLSTTENKHKNRQELIQDYLESKEE